MKYAFIALIAIYLIIYGCSPDSSEKAEKNHKETVQTTVKTAPDSEKAAQQETQFPALHDGVSQTQLQIEELIIDKQPVAEEEPVVQEQQPAIVAESEQVVLPCGRVVNKADIVENGPPCLTMQPSQMQDTAATAGTEQELAAALQQMVKTTNDMVLATRQLVLATQEILNASKKIEEKQQAEQSAPAQQ